MRMLGNFNFMCINKSRERKREGERDSIFDLMKLILYQVDYYNIVFFPKFIDLTILKVDFHDKIPVLARATL